MGIVTPLYRGIRENHSGVKKLDWYLPVQLGKRKLVGEVWTQEPLPG